LTQDDYDSHYTKWNWLNQCPAGRFDSPGAFKVKVELSMRTFLAPLFLLFGPIINASAYIAQSLGNETGFSKLF